MEQGGEKMIGIYKLLISILIIIIATVCRELVVKHVLGAFSTEESDFHYKLLLCILLAAWIVREGLW